MSDPVVLAGVDKRFGAVQALSGASLTLRRGRVGAIVGENGAGKSTLAKIVAGILPRDAGEFRVDGAAVRGWSRRQAIAAGVGFVPQSLSFVATLSVVENHLLSGVGLRLDRRRARRDLEAAMAQMQVVLDLDAPVERLSLPEAQLGEIVAALAAGARILLLDEPTSSLGPLEIDRLILTLRRLAAQGATVALVTHRIAEVMRGCDDITVLRGGRVLMHGATAGLDADAVARLMVGERDRSGPARTSVALDWERLKVEDVVVRDGDKVALDRVSFSIRQGEILAVAGVSGASQPALAEVVAGLRPPASGRVAVDGVDVAGDPALAAQAGLAYIPEKRSEALVDNLTIAENASLLSLGDAGLRRFGLRRRSAELALGARVVAAFDVRPADPRLPAGALSGGNQQKLLVGRELARNPGVIVAHGPTQGLDVAASAAIRSALAQAAAAGAAVLVISADLDELLALGHRMVVLTNGRIAAQFDLTGAVDMTAIGQAMTGLSAGPLAA